MLCNLSKQTNSSGNGQNALACSCGWVGGERGEGIRMVSVPHSVLPIPVMSSVLINYVQNNMHCFAFLYHLLHHMKHISCSWSFLFSPVSLTILFLQCWTLDPLTPKISLVILLTVCQTILLMLVWRTWYGII